MEYAVRKTQFCLSSNDNWNGELELRVFPGVVSHDPKE